MIALIVFFALCAFLHARTGLLSFVGVAIAAILLFVGIAHSVAWAVLWVAVAAVVFPVLRVTWVYFRYRRLMQWNNQHRLFLTDRELVLLARNYSTQEAKEIVEAGFW